MPLKTMNAEHVHRALANVARAEETKDVFHKAVASAFDIRKRIDIMLELLGAAEARNVRLKEECDALCTEMEKSSS